MRTELTARHPATSGLVDRVVLLVDDHARTLCALRQVVELAGLACFATVSSWEALRFCHERKPCLVVTDLAMPELDGHGLGLSIQAKHPGVPMLLVTGELLDSADLYRLGATFNAVLLKPLQVDRFLTLVQKLVPPEDGRTVRSVSSTDTN